MHRCIWKNNWSTPTAWKTVTHNPILSTPQPSCSFFHSTLCGLLPAGVHQAQHCFQVREEIFPYAQCCAASPWALHAGLGAPTKERQKYIMKYSKKMGTKKMEKDAEGKTYKEQLRSHWGTAQGRGGQGEAWWQLQLLKGSRQAWNRLPRAVRTDPSCWSSRSIRIPFRDIRSGFWVVSVELGVGLDDPWGSIHLGMFWDTVILRWWSNHHYQH